MWLPYERRDKLAQYLGGEAKQFYRRARSRHPLPGHHPPDGETIWIQGMKYYPPGPNRILIRMGRSHRRACGIHLYAGTSAYTVAQGSVLSGIVGPASRTVCLEPATNIPRFCNRALWNGASIHTVCCKPLNSTLEYVTRYH